MYASGSTWLFNVVSKVAEALSPKLTLVSHFVSRTANKGILSRRGDLLIVKSHETDADTEAALAIAADLILISIRDPLDVVASQIQYHHCDFANALDLAELSARQCTRFTNDPRALVLRYESGFIDDSATLDRLAARLGGTLARADRTRIFAATRRHELERYIATMAGKPSVLINRESGDLLDPTTHWHTHHAGRTGEISRWRRLLSAAQVLIVNDKMSDWMTDNLYPPNRNL
jgi:hypothetical protein